jgi:hypothetical protein
MAMSNPIVRVHLLSEQHHTLSRSRQLWSVILAAMFVIAGGFADAAYGQAKNTPFGVLMTPSHMPLPGPADIGQAIFETATVGGHVSYMVEWPTHERDIENIEGLLPIYRMMGLEVFLQFAPTSVGGALPPEGYATTFADPALRALYLDNIRRLAEFEPEYLNLAAEINLLYYANPQEWDHFKSLYQEAYAAAKAISPTTQIGVSFHLDLLFGFGQLELIGNLGPQDYIGFTTYPSWTVEKGVFASVADIPTDYYARIRTVLGSSLPVIFAEVGWSHDGGTTLEEQAAYVAELPRLMNSTAPTLITWSMLHDVDHFKVEYLTDEQRALLEGFDLDPAVLFAQLNSMGLLAWNGPPKPSWFAALNLVFSF